MFKVCVDGIIRRCVLDKEYGVILHHCHDRETRGHFEATRTAAKLLQLGFYWPSHFKDAYKYVSACNRC